MTATTQAGAITVTVPFEPRYLSAPSSTYKIPAPGEIHRRGDGSISDHDDTLSLLQTFHSPWLPESDADIAARCRPLKHDDGLEALYRANCGFAAIDLELVRLNGNLELPGAGIRTREASLDKLDVGIRVIDPDRGRASAFTCLFDTQRGLVIFRVCGRHLQNRRCRVKRAVV